MMNNLIFSDTYIYRHRFYLILIAFTIILFIKCSQIKVEVIKKWKKKTFRNNFLRSSIIKQSRIIISQIVQTRSKTKIKRTIIFFIKTSHKTKSTINFVKIFFLLKILLNCSNNSAITKINNF
jgi:hypothetical protein